MQTGNVCRDSGIPHLANWLNYCVYQTTPYDIQNI